MSFDLHVFEFMWCTVLSLVEAMEDYSMHVAVSEYQFLQYTRR